MRNHLMSKFLLYILLLTLSWSTFLYAKSEEHPFPLNRALIKQLKKQGSLLISDKVGKYILRAEGLAEDKKYNQAIELLKYHYERHSFTETEKAHLAMHIGYIYRQNKNNKQSLFYLQKALNFKALPYHQHLSSLYNVSQIHVEQDKHDQALKLLKFWFSINHNPFPQSYILLAHCYYAKKQLHKALKYVEKTISLIRKPKESWLQFAVSIHLKQNNYKKAQNHLESLVALYPSNPSHWKQLAGVYLYLNKNKYALLTLDMAHNMGHLEKHSEYLNLSSLYMEQGLPYQGAKFLKQKIHQNLIPKKQKYFEMLAEAFWLAREDKSALVYLKEASRTAKKAFFFLKYGQKLLDQEEWMEAEKAFQKALNTKEMQETIKNIQIYKKNLVLINKEKNQKLLQMAYPQNNKKQKDSLPEKKNQTPTPQITHSIIKQIKRDDPKRKNRSLLKSPPTNHLEKVYLGIGVALYQQKKYEKALSYFKKSIEVDDAFLSGYQWIDYTEKSILEQKKKN